jgi:carotenoid cleavage dioxygenase-like enzyme
MVTERCEVNRDFVGKDTAQWAYLMKRGSDAMYDGFIKYDMKKDTIDTVVEFGEKRLGGEALFVSREGATCEDDGYLMDIIFDGTTKGSDGVGTSELCIWDAAKLSEGPIACVDIPQRVPFGVHANWLTQAELAAQADWF